MKIGIFGGTFDPPHLGHIKTFKAFYDKFKFDKTYVIPVSTPPHKQIKSTSTTQDRLNMSRLAFETIANNIEVSDIEIKRQGKSYTADTIKHFKDQGCDEIYFLCGTDMLLTLDSWYKPNYIFENATIVYARRESELDITEKISEKILIYQKNFNAKIEFLDISILEISSTEIRNSFEKVGAQYLSPEVYDYIKANGLYN